MILLYKYSGEALTIFFRRRLSKLSGNGHVRFLEFQNIRVVFAIRFSLLDLYTRTATKFSPYPDNEQVIQK